MNKKFSTLVAALLLSGALVSVEAASLNPEDIKTGIELANNGATIKFTGDVDLENNYLLIADDNVVIDGNYNQYTLKGRLVITGKNVTVKNLNIVLKNEASNNSVYKNAITVLSSSVTLTGNKITCEESESGYMANGISIFPTAVDAKFTINGNTIIGANSVVGQWQSAGILLSENIVHSLGDDINVSEAVTLNDFDITTISNNTYKNCAADYLYSTYKGNTTFDVYKIISVTPLKDSKTGDYNNVSYISSLVENTNEKTEAIFNGTAEEFQKIVKDNNIPTESVNVAVQCTGDENGEGAANVLFGEVTNPDNGLGAVIAGITPAAEKVGGYELFKTVTNQFGLLMITEEDGTPYIVSQNKDSEAEVKEVANVDLGDYEHNEAALWQMECVPTLDGQYQYKFVNKLGEQLKATSTTNDANAKNGIFVSYMKYGEYGVALHNVQNNKILSFGLYKTADNYFTGNQLIKRYGDYFTLDITYKNDKNQDVDVTGVFDGQLRPVFSVRYSAGEATYVDAKTQDEFMLVNEEGNIIVIDTKAPLFEAPSDHGYAFTTITPKQWTEWQNTASLQTKYSYVTNFKLAYDYNNQSTTEAVTSIEIGGYTVGLEKKEGNIILVADIENHLLDDPTISIKLNAGNGIAAKDWLTSPSYYTVEAINKDKKAPHYGKVLGLNESGYIDWVAPENVDLTKPEGQFAIDQNYHFTNREYKDASVAYQADPILEDGKLYKVAGEDNVYALVTPEGNDTLRITPITTYQSKDGFKRFTASELSANTYTVAMKSLMGDPFIIENHNDKHRLGLSADEYTEWRIEMPTVKLLDATDDFTRMAADTVKVLTPITYYVGAPVNSWVTTQIDDPEAKYYAPNTQLEICTYVLKNTDNGEYLDGQDYTESAGNAYYVCNADKKTATRIAFKENGEGTVNLVPAYGYYDYKISNTSYWTQDWMTGMSMNEVEGSSLTKYVDYANNLWLSSRKIIGGTSASTGVLKDEYLYKATTNDLFVIAPAEAPTYKKMEQGDKIILSLKNNTENVLVEGPKGELATISNREAHKDLNPTLYVDTAYVNRAGNYAYQYLLGVRINRVDTTYECNVPAHGTHRADTTFGYFLVNMIDSAKACTDVHNNKFVYNNEYKLDFVEGYHTNDTLFFTNEAGEVTSKMEVGNGDFNIAKYAFKMVDEFANEFVIETAAGYTKKYNMAKDNNGHWHWTVASIESVPGYLRWVNGNLVVTSNIDEAAHFTMEASDKEATANEAISAGNVVVAGTNGAVVVKGAEGKNVIVSTILGKVVANEVVSSDNAQIATPAGIVVVSVDGESFKVVVK